MAQASADLAQLARDDAVAAPLAALQTIALAAAEEPGWDAGVPALGQNRLDAGTPLLHDLTLSVDPGRQRALLARLTAVLARSGNGEAHALGSFLASDTLHPLALLAASLTQDATTMEGMAGKAGVQVGLLAVVAHAASLPLLLACGRRAEPLIRSASWSRGCCPVCAAWPLLVEVRGLARDQVLRCGRCASAWKAEPGTCTYCGNQDHQSQGYLAPERERESRRAVVCDACGGYLKSVATLGALGPADLLVRDLQSLELDLAALGEGYQRPDGLGYDLEVRVEPAVAVEESQDANGRQGARRGWWRWRT